MQLNLFPHARRCAIPVCFGSELDPLTDWDPGWIAGVVWRAMRKLTTCLTPSWSR
jgi:hypothetical protein